MTLMMQEMFWNVLIHLMAAVIAVHFTLLENDNQVHRLSSCRDAQHCEVQGK